MNVMDLLRLDQKVALVTGASRGLGYQIAQALGEAGAIVAITARKAAELEQAAASLQASGIRTLAVPCDIADPAAVQAAIERVQGELRGIDVLVNNAGATWGAPFQDIPLEAWHKVINTNVNGTFYVSRAVALGMIARGQGGRLINIASVAGLSGTDPRILDALPYNTSKGAIVNFTRDFAAKLAPNGINVNCICPGFFPTKMSTVTIERGGDVLLDAIPMHRVGGPDDLKGLAVLLASPASAYITGQVIAVDGGQTIW